MKAKINNAKVYFTHGTTPNSYGHAEVHLTCNDFFSPFTIKLSSQIGSSTGLDFYGIELGVKHRSKETLDLQDLEDARAFLKPLVKRLSELNEKVGLDASPTKYPRGTTHYMAMLITNLLLAAKADLTQVGYVGMNWISEDAHVLTFDNKVHVPHAIFQAVLERLEELKAKVGSCW